MKNVRLEDLLRAKQDQLRGRPLTRWEIFYDDHVRHTDWLFVSMIVSIVVWTLLVEFILIAPSIARDLDGRYANSPLKEWFNHLASGKGLCCAEADGTGLNDPNWESRDGHYRVRIPRAADSTDLEWIDVPNDALVTQPNLAGKTMVWPVYSPTNYGVYITIRCFMPGVMM